jgi:hypothetical protein
MPASVLQALYSSSTSTTATQNITVTAGSSIIVWVQITSPTATTTGVSDTLNGSYGAFKDTVTVDVNNHVTSWNIDNTAGGANTVTVTFSASLGYLMYVVEVGGTTGLIGHTGQLQTSPGTGADAISSGTASASSAPALIVGFSQDQTFTTVIAAGTGFTSAGSSFGAMIESMRVTVSGSYAATYTASDGSASSFATFVAIYAESSAGIAVAWFSA